MSLMGIDIGTTGSKCTVFRDDGEVLAYAYREYPIEHPAEGRFELNPKTVWLAVKEIIGEATSQVRNDPVTALAVSSIGEAVVPLDKNGEVLDNSILYIDSRGSAEAEILGTRIGPARLMQLTGAPLSGMYSICKIMWIQAHQPELYRATETFLLYADFIVFMLTGAKATDYSLASRTLAFNVTRKQWEPEILAAAGLDGRRFAPVIAPGSAVGRVRPDVAAEIGLSDQTLVVAGGHDQPCAALGAGIIRPGMAVDGMGTAECLTTAYREPVLNDRMLGFRFNCEPHVVDDLYVSLAFTVSAGGLLRWYRDTFCLQEKAEAAAADVSAYALLDRRASTEPTSLLVLPHFSGSGTPYFDSHARGAILGLTTDTRSSEIYRALMEGASFEMRHNLECLKEAGVTIQKIRAVGGGARSDLWLQIKADIYGMELETLQIDEAGTLGTAMLAGVARGIYDNVEEAARLLVRPKSSFAPDPRRQRVYNDRFEAYRKMYPLVRGVLGTDAVQHD